MAELKPLSEAEREELIAYLDGELSQTDALTIEKKLHSNPQFRAEADALRKTYNLLEYLPKAEPSANFTHRTLDRVTAARPAPRLRSLALTRRWVWRFGWVAALIVVALLGYAAVPTLRPASKTAEKDLSVEQEQQMTRDLRLLEQLRQYQHVSDIHFLNELDRLELFGDDLGH
jgi:anti-sigma factor RsiW